MQDPYFAHPFASFRHDDGCDCIITLDRPDVRVQLYGSISTAS